MNLDQESPEKNSKWDTEGWTEVIPTKSSSFWTKATSCVYWCVESTTTYSKYHCHGIDSKLMKHSNPFIYLSDDSEDEDNNEAPTVKSALVSINSEDENNNEAPTVKSALVNTTSDKFKNDNKIGMNDDAFYISTNLDQQQQLPDLPQYHRTPVGLATSALEINHIIGPELEEKQHQQPPTPPSTLTRIFETVLATVLTPFNALWSHIQPQEAIDELEIELNINNSPSDISNPGDSSNSKWGNNNNRTSLVGPSLDTSLGTLLGTSPDCSLGTFIGASLALGPSLGPSLGASLGLSPGTSLGTSLESVTMSHWHNPSSCPFEKGYPIIIRTKLEREYCNLVLVLRKATQSYAKLRKATHAKEQNTPNHK